MVEVMQWAGICLRVLLAVIFFVTPGIAFWLAVVGLAMLIRRFGHSNIWQIVRNKVRVAFSLSSVG